MTAISFQPLDLVLLTFPHSDGHGHGHDGAVVQQFSGLIKSKSGLEEYLPQLERALRDITRVRKVTSDSGWPHTQTRQCLQVMSDAYLCLRESVTNIMIYHDGRVTQHQKDERLEEQSNQHRLVAQSKLAAVSHEIEMAAYVARCQAREASVRALEQDRTRLQAALNHCDTSLVTLDDLSTCMVAVDDFATAISQQRFSGAFDLAKTANAALERLQYLRGTLPIIDSLGELAAHQHGARQDNKCLSALKTALEPYVTSVASLVNGSSRRALQAQRDHVRGQLADETIQGIGRERLEGEVAALDAMLTASIENQITVGCSLLVVAPAQQQLLIDWVCEVQLVSLRRDLATTVRKTSSDVATASPWQLLNLLGSQVRADVARFRDELGGLLPSEWRIDRRIGCDLVANTLRPLLVKYLGALAPNALPPFSTLKHATRLDEWIGIEASDEEEQGLASALRPWVPRMVQSEFHCVSAWLATVEQQEEWDVDARDLTCRFSESQHLLLLLRQILKRCRDSQADKALLADAARRSIVDYVRVIEQQVVFLVGRRDSTITSSFRRTFYSAAINTCTYLEQQYSAIQLATLGEQGKIQDNDALQDLCGSVVFQSIAALTNDTVYDGSLVTALAVAPLDAHLKRCVNGTIGSDASAYVRQLVVCLEIAHAPLATLPPPLLGRLLVASAQRFFDTWSSALWATHTKMSPQAARQMLVDLDLVQSFWSAQQQVDNRFWTKVVDHLVVPWSRIFKVLSVVDAQQMITLFQALHQSLESAAQPVLLGRIFDLRGLTSGQQQKLIAAHNSTSTEKEQIRIAPPPRTSAALFAQAQRLIHGMQQLAKS